MGIRVSIVAETSIHSDSNVEKEGIVAYLVSIVLVLEVEVIVIDVVNYLGKQHFISIKEDHYYLIQILVVAH